MNSLAIKLVVLASAVGLVLARDSEACSCKDVPPERMFATSAATFVGKLRATREQDRYLVFTFEVERAWKGPVTETVEVATDELSSCAPDLVNDAEYLVFARPSAEKPSRFGWSGLTVDLCSVRRTAHAKAYLGHLAKLETVAPVRPPEVVASLERGVGCVAPCGRYAVEILSDASVRYEGKACVKTMGTRTTHLAPTQMKSLEKAFADADFFKLRGDFECLDETDSPTTVITYRVGEKQRTIRHYHGCLSAPAALTQLEGRIESIVGAALWTGTVTEQNDLCWPRGP